MVECGFGEWHYSDRQTDAVSRKPYQVSAAENKERTANHLYVRYPQKLLHSTIPKTGEGCRTVCGLAVVSIGIYYLDVVLGGTAPLLDTLSLSIAIVANLLCSLCYKEQWILWFALDIIQTILYFAIGQPIMAVMYIAWIVNCVYGWYNWNKQSKIEGV